MVSNLVLLPVLRTAAGRNKGMKGEEEGGCDEKGPGP
jgi:hypothetical protein